MVMRTVFVSMVALALGTSSAAAQSTSAQAESLFKQARELMAQKQYAEACSAFESSHKLDPAATTMYSLAVCRELEGKLATAWGVWIDFERQHRSSTDATVVELVKKARDRSKKLESRLSTLKVLVPPASRAADLVIERDGITVDRGAWDRPLPVDGGEHTIAVRRPGFQAWTTSVTLKSEGEAQTITVPSLEPAAVATEPVKPVSAPTTPVETAPVVASRSKVVPIVLAGSAVVLGGAAIGFEFWGRKLHDDGQDAYDDENYAKGDDLQSKANMRRYLAQGVGIAAIACAGVSIFLFVRGGGSSESSTTASRFHLVPIATNENAGLGLVGAW